MTALQFDRVYRRPERYKLVPEGKILEPFGLRIEGERALFNSGVFFGRKGQLSYNIYSPINASRFEYNYRERILTLYEEEFGFCIRIHGVRTLCLSSRERQIKRGQLLGTAHQIKSLCSGVYVEGVILQESFKNVLKERFLTSEVKIDPRLLEREYIRQWSIVNGSQYKDSKHIVIEEKYRKKVTEINPYWVVQRPAPYKHFATYFNYSALFC